MGDSVETVLGELSATQLGPTQIHEHVLVDCRSPDPAQHMAFEPLSLSNYYDARYSDDHQGALLLDSVEDAAHELRCFAEVGGRTIVDVTPSDLGRRPGGLREVARLTDVNILMGCGFYVHEYHAPEVHDLPVEALSEIILRDCLEGIAVTGPEGQSETVKAGVIGEIGLSWPLIACERKVLVAASRAQRASSRGLVIHPGRHPDALFEAVEIVEGCGVDPARVVMSHVDRTVDDPATIERLAVRGFSSRSTCLVMRAATTPTRSSPCRTTAVVSALSAPSSTPATPTGCFSPMTSTARCTRPATGARATGTSCSGSCRAWSVSDSGATCGANSS